MVIKPTTFVVLPEEDAALFAEGVTAVKVEDEGGGCYIVLEQGGREIRIDFSEWKYLTEAVKRLEVCWTTPQKEELP